jgi:hypothetical protein
MTSTERLRIATFFCIFLSAMVQAKTVASPGDRVRQGFAVAQACEAEIDDDLTSYGECIGHAVDRMAGQRLSLLGLNFQAWLIADLAARQGGTRAAPLRQRYQEALFRSLRANGWSVQQLCKAKKLACEPVQLRLRQRI